MEEREKGKGEGKKQACAQAAFEPDVCCTS